MADAPMRWAGGALLLALISTCDPAAAAPAPCYGVHGKLFAANGAPTFRIWPIGTRRLLGVPSSDPDALPAVLRGDRGASMSSPPEGAAVDVYGDFTVCPITRDRPGWMRMVTVKAVRHPLWVRRH
jgi:hypothetical protein